MAQRFALSITRVEQLEGTPLNDMPEGLDAMIRFYDEMTALHNFIFNVYEIGSITLDQYLDTVIFNHPRDFVREDFKEFMYAQSVELPGMLAWLKEWKKDCGFRIISINNEGKELNDYRVQKFKLHTCFDAFISSCEVKMPRDESIGQELHGSVSER